MPHFVELDQILISGIRSIYIIEAGCYVHIHKPYSVGVDSAACMYYKATINIPCVSILMRIACICMTNVT